ncbi:XRE family transcriptional regulator [Ktedonosporobacter rubrisoli]|uniref:XRE family transcriptional regulator n=1 Tax=Ktedonosporobacter rubrisoli TaxID=2509675 RepID=A0A4V0Z006_KTERU|nr:helix-turn-helix transcriptional regulator [Ktedonosporobacter rubrisoli]QBD81551.1 XRE family transcriptional regulator [Ktedonosporobacter rubrisoli]
MIRLRVKEIAARRGISQRQLVLRSGLDIRVVQRVMRNSEENITLATLDKLARALNIDPSLLIESEPPLPKTLEESAAPLQDGESVDEDEK